MATSGQGIWVSLGNSGSVRDYRHAAQIFRTNDYSRAPKSKYQFYVRFNIDPAARSAQFTSSPSPTDPNELGYLVRTVDMPKFELDVQDLNQYNKKVIVQRGIRYTPIMIKFFDDNVGSLRHFWQSYYNYYYADGSYSELDFDPANNDLYNPRSLSRWGLDTGAITHYLRSIEIYSLYHGQAQLITLQNPVISNFSHDTHDYSDGTGSVEPQMTIHYAGVTYDEGIDSSYGIPGYGQTSPETYDTEQSPLNPNGLQINISTGASYSPNGAKTATKKKTYNNNPGLGVQTSVYNTSNRINPATISNKQLNSMLQYNGTNAKNITGYQFPSAQLANPNANYVDFGAIDNRTNRVSTSDGVYLNSPQDINTLYPVGTWQNSMLQKGYSAAEINAAETYILSQGLGAFGAGLPPDENGVIASPNYQEVAENYLNAVQDASYAQDASVVNLSSSVQPVYNGNTWQSQLLNEGYTPTDIATAEEFFSKVNTSPNVNLANSARSYINSKDSKINY